MKINVPKELYKLAHGRLLSVATHNLPWVIRHARSEAQKGRNTFRSIIRIDVKQMSDLDEVEDVLRAFSASGDIAIMYPTVRDLELLRPVIIVLRKLNDIQCKMYNIAITKCKSSARINADQTCTSFKITIFISMRAVTISANAPSATRLLAVIVLLLGLCFSSPASSSASNQQQFTTELVSAAFRDRRHTISLRRLLFVQKSVVTIDHLALLQRWSTLMSERIDTLQQIYLHLLHSLMFRSFLAGHMFTIAFIHVP